MSDFYTKSFVIPFYKAFLGFFILVLLITCVFMEFRQHLLIAERIVENNFAYLGLVGFVLIFSLFQIRFQLLLMNDSRYLIFHLLAFLDKKKFILVYLGIWTKTHALLLCYSFFFTYVSFNLGRIEKAFLLVLLLFGVFVLDFMLLYFKVQKPIPERTISKSILFPKIPFSIWFLKQLSKNRPFLLLGVKLVSLLLLSGFLISYQSGGYDWRWVAFGLLNSSFLHYPVWLEKVRFEQEELGWFLGLPRNLLAKILANFISLGILLIPEILLILLRYSFLDNPLESTHLALFFVGTNLGLYGLVIRQAEQIDWVKVIIGSFFLVFLLILFSLPIYFISLLGLSIFIFTIHHPYRI